MCANIYYMKYILVVFNLIIIFVQTRFLFFFRFDVTKTFLSSPTMMLNFALPSLLLFAFSVAGIVLVFKDISHKTIVLTIVEIVVVISLYMFLINIG